MRPDAEAIIAATCSVCGITKTLLFAQHRWQKLVEARRIASYLMVDGRGLSMPQAGKIMQRDHTTILHHVRTVRRRLEAGDTDLAATIARVGRLASERRLDLLDAGRCLVYVKQQPKIFMATNDNCIRWGSSEKAYAAAISHAAALPRHWRD